MTSAPSLVGTVLAYTVARLCLVAAVAGLLVLAGVPLLLAALIGVIVALPLSMMLLRGLRVRVDAGMAAVRERRSAQREVLRARLRGEDLPAVDDRSGGPDRPPERSGEGPDRQPERSGEGPDGQSDRSGEGAEGEPDTGEPRPEQQ